MAETYDGLTDVDPLTDPRVELADLPVDWTGERYRVIDSIGRGGMGEIELCKDTRIARNVARKLLGKELKADPRYRSRFLFEARLQGQLEHPSIVPVHDLGETAEGDLFFTMKRVNGITLADALSDVRDRASTLTRRRLLTAFSSVCLAVDFAHTRGVVHRDLKPQNIMLGNFGEVYVLDWGIAKLMGTTDAPLAEAVAAPAAAAVTRGGATLGTPMYMAPERGEGVANARTDIYSLGVILRQILESHEDIPPELASICRRATEDDPELRFSSARELQEAVERYLDGDRDLEARRTLAAKHVGKAEQALDLARTDPAARTQTAREVGRALGLDPSNAEALRILMRLLSDMPSELPPDAAAEIERRWLVRRARTLRIGSWMTLLLLLTIPFIAACGIRSWPHFAAFVGSVVCASVFQGFAARSQKLWQFAAGYIFQLFACAALVPSAGLFGIVPVALTTALIAWRQAVHRTLAGVTLLLGQFACLLVPLVLSEVGVLAQQYRFEDGALTILPVMNELPRLPTLVYVVAVTFGVLVAASIYCRLFVSEIRRAEAQLTFQAWQLQQLVPPEPKRA